MRRNYLETSQRLKNFTAFMTQQCIEVRHIGKCSYVGGSGRRGGLEEELVV